MADLLEWVELLGFREWRRVVVELGLARCEFYLSDEVKQTDGIPEIGEELFLFWLLLDHVTQSGSE